VGVFSCLFLSAICHTTFMNWWMLRRKLHSSWLIGMAAAGVVIGVIASQYLPVGLFASWVWCGAALGAMAVCLWSRWVLAIPIIIVSGCLLGLWRGSVAAEATLPYVRLAGHVVTLHGKVADDPERDAHGLVVVRLTDVTIDGHSLPGTVRSSTVSSADIKRGDQVGLHGKLQAGFGGFAATLNRAEMVAFARPEPGDVARIVRDGFADNVRRVIPEPQVSLGLGYLLGQRRGLPDELSQALVVAGLTHVVVASGYNLTILVRLMRRLFVRVSKYLAFATSGALIVGFIAVTGMSPSMSRAGLVAGLSLLAWYYGRKFHPLVLLAGAAAVTLLMTPSYGQGDVGWQLSFASFAGVMFVAPLGQHYFFGDAKPGLIRQILGETIAAFVVTLPILIVTFGQFSTVAIIANLLVLPLVPLAMLLVFLAGVFAVFFPPLASLIGALASWLLGYMVWVAETIAQWPWAQVNVQLTIWIAAASYVALVAACLYVWRVTKWSPREASIVE
jgi:competence protein ComEC